MSAEEAVADVQSGQAVVVAMFDGMPPSLCTALANRAPELEDVTVFHFVSPFPWFGFDAERPPDRPPAFRQITPFCTNVDRDAVREGKVEYLPAALWRAGQLPHGVG